METPVLLIAFNRPDLAAQVFARIREAQPRQLFVACDGPRGWVLSDAALCEQTRAVFRVDWPCELHTNFQADNLGCGVHMWKAMDWAFQTAERIVMLEDDTLPHLDYFRVVDDLLDRYEHHRHIWCVSGARASREQMKPGDYSYEFTPSVWTCSLATWKDRWRHYDFHVKSWGLSDAPRRRLERRMQGGELQSWIASMDEAYICSYLPRYQTFDYQFQYLVKQFGYGVVTAHSMITNTGFRPDGTNATSGDSPVANLPAYGMEFPMKHPPIPEPLPELV